MTTQLENEIVAALENAENQSLPEQIETYAQILASLESQI